MVESVNKYKEYLLLLSVFLASRLYLLKEGVAPDLEYLRSNWQYLDIKLLREDLLTSLWFQHSQPPLQNLLAGLTLKTADFIGVSERILFSSLYSILSLFVCVLLYKIISKYIGKIGSLAVSIVFVVSPAVIFYENYIFYSHVVLFLSTVVVYGSVKLYEREGRDGVWLLVSVAGGVLLSLTWALFHPIYVFALTLWNCYIYTWKNNISTKVIVILAVLLIISVSPSIKNYHLFGTFSNSSWVGLNVSQVAPRIDESNSPCKGKSFKKISDYNINYEYQKLSRHNSVRDTLKSTGHTNFNNYGYVKASERCLSDAAGLILSSPSGYLTEVILTMGNSHSNLATDYPFQPRNWENIRGYVSTFRSLFTLDIKTKYQHYDLHFTLIAIYLITYILSIWFLYEKHFVRGNLGSTVLTVYLCLGTILFVTLVGHLLNDGEQNRMRYSISTLYIIIYSICAPWLISSLKSKIGGG